MSILMAIGMVSLKGLALIGIGFSLGLGIYLSRKLTNRVDELLLSRDSKLRQLKKEMGLVYA